MLEQPQSTGKFLVTTDHMHFPLLLSFWFTVGTYGVHCIDESLSAAASWKRCRSSGLRYDHSHRRSESRTQHPVPPEPFETAYRRTPPRHQLGLAARVNQKHLALEPGIDW